MCACVVLGHGLTWKKEKTNYLLQTYKCCKKKLTVGEEIIGSPKYGKGKSKKEITLNSYGQRATY